MTELKDLNKRYNDLTKNVNRPSEDKVYLPQAIYTMMDSNDLAEYFSEKIEEYNKDIDTRWNDWEEAMEECVRCEIRAQEILDSIFGKWYDWTALKSEYFDEDYYDFYYMKAACVVMIDDWANIEKLLSNYYEEMNKKYEHKE